MSNHHTQLFTQQFQGEIHLRIVSTDDVIKHFIHQKAVPDEEIKSLKELKAVDQKINNVIKLMEDGCKKHDLNIFNAFIEALSMTKMAKNVEFSKQLRLIYEERKNAIQTLKKLEEANNYVEDLEKEISGARLRLEQKEKSLQQMRDEKQRLTERMAGARAIKDEISLDKQKLQHEIDKKDKVINSMTTDINNLKKNKRDLENVVKEKSTSIENYQKVLLKTENDLKNTISERNKLLSELEGIKDNTSGVNTENQNLSNEVKKLEHEISEKDKNIEKLKQSQTMTREDVEKEFDEKFQKQSVEIKQMMEETMQQMFDFFKKNAHSQSETE